MKIFKRFQLEVFPRFLRAMERFLDSASGGLDTYKLQVEELLLKGLLKKLESLTIDRVNIVFLLIFTDACSWGLRKVWNTCCLVCFQFIRYFYLISVNKSLKNCVISTTKW